jgi:glycosyltransferase involved in cell wall biosynthesis
MTCHNYRLTCPALSHLRHGEVCEKCVDGHEHWCALKNCRDNVFESVAYSLHNVVARRSGLFMNNVTLFIALTEFSRSRLQAAGVPAEKLVVLPNMFPSNMIPSYSGPQSVNGSYAAFVGRFSAQKGIDVLFSAAVHSPGVPVWVAGDSSTMPQLREMAPKNVKLVGQLNPRQLARFYENSRFLVLPSKGLEGCPMVIIEAMSYGLPVIASRIGALREMVDEGVTGMLFESGNPEDLASKMRMLWENSALCRQMGHMAREKAMREYNGEAHYRKLIALYEKAIQMKRSWFAL